MTHQSEATLEKKLIDQLNGLGYKRVEIRSESDLLDNLKQQFEVHNEVKLSDQEFKRVLNILNKGSVFERAKLLRQKHFIEQDNGDILYFDFLNTTAWCKNQFQVTNQITIDGKYQNRYDVTILINGLPITQIELKRRGCEMAEAHRQILRYKSHSFASGSGLFQLVQLFVISNGVNTKYFANNRLRALNFKQTFFWAKEDNTKISQLTAFAETFLEPCHLSKMISKYIVLAETDRLLMVLRPYQYYATEKIIKRVEESNKNGYIWHTTGSGKTLTSFKASQLIKDLPEVNKVVFVVDRRDLDYQTTKEFNNFSDGSVDGTDNTKALVRQFGDDTKLIVTTIQKLNNAISNKRYAKVMAPLQEKKMVFIFDECHRSQFGETHKRIKAYFKNVQMFGFTGTPIFAENAVKNQLGRRTTKELFGECLHKYVITDAIRDENVLKFSVEYIGRYKRKAESSLNFVDIEVEDIDTKEVLESEDRLEKIVNYIIASHPVKTHNEEFTAMLCVSSIDAVKKYYEIFKQKKEAGLHDLRIATIFSYDSNQEVDEADGITTLEYNMAAEEPASYNSNNRKALDAYLDDYNAEFKTQYSTKSSQDFYNYYNDVSKRVKNKEIDLLIVVNMFLTGFDSKPLNTLYVDKNLRHHGLIQAFSRTNRILNSKKSHGNIIVFRNLKEATDDAIALFSNKDARETILMEPYEDYLDAFVEAYKNLKEITPTVDSVNGLASEIEEEQFVKRFRALMRIINALSTFSDFSFDDLEMDKQDFEDYKSKYLDLYEKTRQDSETEKASILNDVDFEVELIHKDNINVAYILNLLEQFTDSTEEEQEQKRKKISDLLSGDLELRSKKELIEKFIDQHLINGDITSVQDAFELYWSEQQKKAFQAICEEENLNPTKVESIIEEKIYTNEVPELREKVRKSMEQEQSILVRRKSIPRIISKINNFIQTFIEGMAA
ncbi:type I restriction endonuclease subunit R [Mesohalobacter halotolerans]|uniref:Type I restriction enzyme endonuclease subunit n=1 Tax=Mesohalobacter halotolerans TaxID=1883405 RepID=A0A4V6ALE8_9FLAO|nr:type I restriction endonuclease subunit R [Mesohalobacter halotolerans]TKS56485.1 type I restriction endonuclease subunit R [Mesohalobacter halotolerans]